MKEIELKAVIDDVDSFRQMLLDQQAAGLYSGFMEDIIFDHPKLNITADGENMRLRRYENSQTKLQWKGPVKIQSGFKEREELSAAVDNSEDLIKILEKLGFKEKSRIKRYIELYKIEGVTFRIERYTRMDTLVEVEGEPEAINSILGKLPVQRGDFSGKTFREFINAYEKKTGEKAIIT